MQPVKRALLVDDDGNQVAELAEMAASFGIQSLTAVDGQDALEKLSAGDVDVDRLQSHNWPGNARELRDVVERAVVLAAEGTILPQHLLLRDKSSDVGQKTDCQSDTMLRAPVSSGRSRRPIY